MLNNLFKTLSALLFLLLTSNSYANCTEVARKCIDQGGTRVVDGQVVTRDCFGYEVEFQCTSNKFQEDSECAQLREQGCTEKDVECGETDPETGRCLFYNKTYDCPNKSETEQIDCSVSSFCQGEDCFDVSYDENKDMGLAVAYLEAARQVSVDLQEGKLFRGEPHFCRVGYGGIRRCCNRKPAPEAFSLSNQFITSMIFSVAYSGLKYAYNYTVALASPYIYDTIIDNLGNGFANFTGFMAPQIHSGVESFAKPEYAPSFSAFGFSATYASATATQSGSQAAMASTNSSVGFVNAANYHVGSVGNIHFIVNPYMVALAAAIAIYQSLSECKPEEHQLALYRGSGSCQYVPAANRCDKRIFGSCVQTKRAFCCYNSILAKILNHAAKDQFRLPKTLGKGKPNCNPITLEQLTKLDFEKVDFSEFIASIAPGGKGHEFWDKKMRDTEMSRQQAQASCQNRPTQEERDACLKTYNYEQGGTPRSFETVDHSKSNPDQNQEFFQGRAEGRVQRSKDEKRADVSTAPDDGTEPNSNRVEDRSEELREMDTYNQTGETPDARN